MEKKDICERTFNYAVAIVKFCRAIDNGRNVERLLSRQLFRSGTSIGANVEEAQAGQSKADFISKMSIARKEARETRYWLSLCNSLNIGIPRDVDVLLKEINELIAILTTIIKKTKGN
ncbi:four helix bundle protein [candidate division TA06 bacterium]|uniref:Four helix bundle protein n=1 Tax=candidate division TA06 bacterium TaxID=2250710 RepID=A0A933I8J6_UNCT6|nr:four helix bundle protein [candidate division TA06 bacterium]